MAVRSVSLQTWSCQVHKRLSHPCAEACACGCAGSADKYAEMLREVVRRTASLVAQWQAIGFVHGVGNTEHPWGDHRLWVGLPKLSGRLPSVDVDAPDSTLDRMSSRCPRCIPSPETPRPVKRSRSHISGRSGLSDKPRLAPTHFMHTSGWLFGMHHLVHASFHIVLSWPNL